MKKSILLIAPLAFLVSCTNSSEIFDDAYNSRKAPQLIEKDKENGYADHIKDHEDRYTVQVDKSQNKSMNGINPSYYGGNDQYTVRNSNGNHQGHNHGGDVYIDNYYNCPGNGNGMNLAWNMCEYSCMTFLRSGNCWHMNGRTWGGYSAYAPGYGWGYTGFYPLGYTNNSFYNQAYFGAYGMYGDPYCNGYFNNNYAWYNGYGSGYGWGNPYGYYGNGWNPYWGYGYGGGNWWNNNNNNGNWWNNNDVASGGGSNHHFGHRGGTNTGSNSQNNTNYEHTVKVSEAQSTPFPAFNGSQGAQVSGESFAVTLANTGFDNNQVNTKPAQSFATSQSNNSNTISKPNNSNSLSNQPVQWNNTKPAVTTNGGGQTIANNTVSKPANTQKFVSKGKPANNQFASNSTGKTTYTTTNTQRYGSSNNSSSSNTYAHGNKYGTGSQSTNTNKSTHTYSGQNNNSSRRTGSTSTNNGSSSGNSGRSWSGSSSGGSSRSNSGSSYSGSRSSSGSSSGGSRSSGGGSSRRR